MHLHKLTIQNFRQLEFIEESFCPGINVIVGRNGVGKSNILEAIRLAKALLAPRTQNESLQALISINAISPHNQNLLIFDAMAGNPKAEIIINCEYKLYSDEIELIKNNIDNISADLVRAELGTLAPANVAAYFSSPMGQNSLAKARSDIKSAFDIVKNGDNQCRLFMNINPQSGLITCPFPIEAQLIGFLDRAMSFDVTKFTYFPADRALPRGDVPIQIGQQDAGQSLESHNSQPHLKYGRLKNMIFNAIIASPDGRTSIKEDFKIIFDNILPGRELDGVGVNQNGLLSIKIKDAKAKRVFDIDQMSSGEKSLILSFLIMSRGIAGGGVVLMDEPELHLHPAVCKELIPFFYNYYTSKKHIQMIICSHSPEILSGAFARDGCELYHLINGTTISSIEPSNKPSVEEALLMLGTTETEGLLYKAIISVEGRDDVGILEEGFPTTLQSYKLKPQGSKSEVLTAIRSLKSLEKSGDLKSTHFFIFDRDKMPANEMTTQLVKVLEWDRYCIENYLIDPRIISKLLSDKGIAKLAPKNSGDVKSRLRNLAFHQIDELALIMAFKELSIPDFTFELSDMAGLDVKSAWDIILERINVRNSYFTINKCEDLASKYEKSVENIRQKLTKDWQTDWIKHCDGKKLFSDCYAEFGLVVSPSKLKKRIVSEMRVDAKNDNWKAWKGQIEKFLKS